MSGKARDWAWKIEGLSSPQKFVLLALAERADDDTLECWPSVPMLARMTSLSERTTQYAINELVQKAMINRVDRDGRSTLYRLTLTGAGDAPRSSCTGAGDAPRGAGDAPHPRKSCTIGGARAAPKNPSVESIKESTKNPIDTTREEDKQPGGASMGAEGSDNSEPAQRDRNGKKRKARIGVEEWEGPSERAYDLLNQHGIPRDFAESLIGEFRLYWEERGERRPGWDASFVNHAKANWDRAKRNPAPIAHGKTPGSVGNYQRENVSEYATYKQRQRAIQSGIEALARGDFLGRSVFHGDGGPVRNGVDGAAGFEDENGDYLEGMGRRVE